MTTIAVGKTMNTNNPLFEQDRYFILWECFKFPMSINALDQQAILFLFIQGRLPVQVYYF